MSDFPEIDATFEDLANLERRRAALRELADNPPAAHWPSPDGQPSPHVFEPDVCEPLDCAVCGMSKTASVHPEP